MAQSPNVPQSVPQNAAWLRHFDADDLLISAARYYTGRRTISVVDFARRLSRAWPELPEHVRSTIRRDLEREFERDDQARASVRWADAWPFPLGDNVDREAWEEVRQAWHKLDEVSR